MRARIAVFLLAAALAAPAGARPLASSHRGATAWVRVAWNDVVRLFLGFRLFDATDLTGHGLPPPPCTTATVIGQ